MENFIKDTYFESYGFGFDGAEFDGFRGKRKAKQAARQENKNVRKAAKVATRTAKKTAKIDRKGARNAAKIERKANRPRVMKIRAKIADQEARTAAEIAETQAQGANERENANLDADAERMANFPPIEPEQQVKVKRYLERRGRKEIEESPEMLAAQFREERGREINQRFEEKLDYLDENADANDPEWYEENYPEYEDIEEEILQEEEDSFAFTGDSDNFLDPDTIAVATNVGKKAADLYRQKRFAAGKKAFGMTKAQYDKKQEEQRKAIAEGTDTVSQLRGAAMQETTRQYIGRNPAIVVLAVVLLGTAIYAVVALNRNLK